VDTRGGVEAETVSVVGRRDVWWVGRGAVSFGIVEG